MYPEKIINSKNASFQVTTALNGGKCGWICRQLNKIANFIEDIPIIGQKLSGNIRLLVNIISAIDDVILRTAGEYEPTYGESIILDNWQLNKLQPFYKELALDLSNAFKQNNLTQQLIIVNNTLNIMCVVKNYFANYELNGLSANAISLRNDLIEKIFEPLYEIIESSFENQNFTSFQSVAKLDNSTINDFYPLITTKTVLSTNCYNYASNSSSNNTIPLVLNDLSTTPKPVVKKSDDNNLLWAGLFFAGVLAITIFNNDKSNKKEKKKK
jgi:hypothetical protein